MEGEQDGAVEETQEKQGQPLEQEEPEARVEPAPDYRALLDRQEARIRELESQVAEAAKSKESDDRLAAEIERLRTDAAASSRSVSHQHSRHYRAKNPA